MQKKYNYPEQIEVKLSVLPQQEQEINSTEEGMLFQLADTTIQACNAAAERILGYTNEQILGTTPFKPPWQTVHEDGSIFTAETYPSQVSLQTGKPCKNIVMGLYQPTGELVWLLLNCQPLFQANKTTPYAVVTTFTDITKIKLWQSNSDVDIKSNKKLLTTPNQNPIDKQRLEQRVAETISDNRSKAFLSMQNHILELIATGTSLSEVLTTLTQSIEMQLAEVFCSIMLLDDSGTKLYPAVSSSLPENYTQAIRDGVPVGAEVGSCGTSAYTKQTVIVSDIANDIKWVEYRDLALANHLKACWSTPILDSHGEVLGTFALYYPTVRSPEESEQQLIERASHLAGVAIERERSQQALQKRKYQLRLMTETIPQQVWTALPNGQVDYFNQRWCDFTGKTQEQLQSQGWEQIIHPEDLPKVKEVWAKAVQNGSEYEVETRMLSGSGEYRWILGQARPLRDQQGQIVKWYGTNTDITDHIQAREAMRNALQQQQAVCEAAEKANLIKDEFLAVLSHELRTPLNPILGWARLLKTGKLDKANTDEALNSIERNAKLQVDLIEDLLDVSRILRGKLTLNVSTVNLATVISAALDTVSLAASAKEIAIQTHLEANIGQVAGDPARLQQIVWNLLSNAVKFTPQGGRVEVWLQQFGSIAQITVSDMGKGINSDFLPHIFEHFRQEDSSITRKFGGLGLGLAIVRQLVELHGGTVEADSPGEGQGAIFIVRIPLISSGPEMLTEKKPQDVSCNLSGIKILFVDDDADSRDFITFVLKLYGAEVTTVASGFEALEVFIQSQPDVLVSDIGMPKMDGYELVRKIRACSSDTGRQIPGIALTAFAGEFDQQQAMTAGFQMHISKPVEPDALAAAVAQVAKIST
ncbi:ATP-binding protein [Anabaena catenula]|uniref:histidine kinase n=1 Tax=Anabaena catenula FACHB-362 TaxID=2692877 RepID=A0ABR8J096_9NOST|nr:ATP-binding protein [Anabaena catenula]MBD2690859.1 PAS domain S-box protein [Anabaena catenula FACHB-362]